MNDVVNLNRFRKRAARDAKAVAASENRARFGQTKADRQSAQKREASARRQHEQHYIEHQQDKREPDFRIDSAPSTICEDQA